MRLHDASTAPYVDEYVTRASSMYTEAACTRTGAITAARELRARAAEHSRGARGSNPTAPARPTLSFDPPEHAEGAARSGGAIYFTSKLDLSSPLGRAAADEKSGPRVDFGRTPLDAGGQRPTRARAVRRGGAWSASAAAPKSALA